MTKKLYVIIGCDTDPVIETNEHEINEQNVLVKENIWNETIQSVVKLKEKIGYLRIKRDSLLKLPGF